MLLGSLLFFAIRKGNEMKRGVWFVAGPMLAAMLAVGAVKTLVIAPKTVADTAELLEMFYTARASLPPLPPPVDYKTVAVQLNESRFDFLSTPDWAFTHSDGTLYLSEKSKFSGRVPLPMRLVAYEDLASGKVVLTGTAIGSKNIQTLAIVDAPEFPPKDVRVSWDKYLMDEIGPRRMIWTAVLKSEKDAWADLMSVQAEPLAAPMMMTMSAPEPITDFRIVQDGTNLSVNLPAEFVGATVELKSSTNLVERIWSTVLQTNIISTGTVFLAHADIPELVISYTTSTSLVACTNCTIPDINCTNCTTVISTNRISSGGVVYYRTSATSTNDTDNDQLLNLAEYELGTDFQNPDSDEDGLKDGFEVQHDFNPLSLPGHSEADEDMDQDGLPDLLEILFFTNMTQTAEGDFDGDGLLNGEEMQLSCYEDPVSISFQWETGTSESNDIAWASDPDVVPVGFASDLTDEGALQVEIGFDFPLFGASYSNLFICVNGILSFEQTFGSFWKIDEIPISTAPALIAPFWADLVVSNGLVTYQTLGQAPDRRFVVTWEDVDLDPWDLELAPQTFQAELQEDGAIIFRYSEINDAFMAISAVSVGIQGEGGIGGLSWLFDSQAPGALTNGHAVLFEPAAKIALVSFPNASDSDQDGLGDQTEVEDSGTDPLDADSDDDGLNDGDEVNLYETNPFEWDSDNDGLSDGAEVNVYATDPMSGDSDGDGLDDPFEINRQPPLDPNEADSDGDLFTDYEEVYVYGTDPLSEDSDGDGVPDGLELNIFITSPQTNDGFSTNTVAVQGDLFFNTNGQCRIWINSLLVDVETNGLALTFSTNVVFAANGSNEVVVLATGIIGTNLVERIVRVPVTVQAYPPDLEILSPLAGAVVDERNVHVTVMSDSTNQVTIGGVAATRDGFIHTAWVPLDPGTNVIVATSLNDFGQTGSAAVGAVCDVPPGTPWAAVADQDMDGVLDDNDPAPNDPAIRSGIYIAEPVNGGTTWQEGK